MKALRLSEKKIHISFEESIFFNDGSGKTLIDTIKIRLVYKKVTSRYEDGTPEVCYYANIKNGFVAGICNKYGIKKKFVLLPHKGFGKIFVVDVDGEKVNVVFNDILLTDKDWYVRWNREQQLKKLLE